MARELPRRIEGTHGVEAWPIMGVSARLGLIGHLHRSDYRLLGVV